MDAIVYRTAWPHGNSATIYAELVGDNTCRAVGITANSSSPVLVLCRQLVAHGFDPALALHAYRGEVLCLHVCSIGEATRLRVAPHGVGFQYAPECTAAPPIAPNGNSDPELSDGGAP
jgi:hypothetical protein